MIPVNVNVYSKGASYFWFRLVVDGDDLDIEESATSWTGEMSEALSYETDQNGVTDLVRPDWKHHEQGGIWVTDTWLTFGLENGIAPGQPFCVRVGEPEYSKTWTDCGYEYDMDLDWDVVQTAPCRNPAGAWERALRRIETARRERREYHERVTERRWTDRAAMELRRSTYFAGRYYDDMAMPNGCRLTLMSLHRDLGRALTPGSYGIDLCSGDSDDGREDEAFESLVKNLRKSRPDVADEAFLRSLPRRYR